MAGEFVDCEGERNRREADVEAGLEKAWVSTLACAASGWLFLRRSSRSRVHGCRDRANRVSPKPVAAERDSEGALDGRRCVLLVREALCGVCPGVEKRIGGRQ